MKQFRPAEWWDFHKKPEQCARLRAERETEQVLLRRIQQEYGVSFAKHPGITRITTINALMV